MTTNPTSRAATAAGADDTLDEDLVDGEVLATGFDDALDDDALDDLAADGPADGELPASVDERPSGDIRDLARLADADDDSAGGDADEDDDPLVTLGLLAGPPTDEDEDAPPSPAADSHEDDDVDGVDDVAPVVPRGAGEFLCPSCFLIHPRHAMTADGVCADCA